MIALLRLLLLAALLLAGLSEAKPRALVCAGTSLTYGLSHDPTPYTARLETLIGVPVVNMGVGSARLSSIVTRWELHAKPFPYRVSVLEGGTNDLAGVGGAVATGAATWAIFEGWIEDAQDAGHEVVAVLIPPRWGSAGWTADMEAERVIFNTALRAYVAANPEVKLLDSDLVLGDGASPPALQAAFDYGDKLHLDGDGMQALAQGIADLL